MKLTDAFVVYILNLPNRADRKERLTAHLDELGLVDWEKVRWKRAVHGGAVPPPSWWSTSPGAWGCHCSHRRALEDAVIGGIPQVLILEDDAVFHPRAGEILELAIKELPADWAQLYLGGNHWTMPQPLAGKDYLLRSKQVIGNHAVAYQRRAIPAILAHIQSWPEFTDFDKGEMKWTSKDFPIDTQLGRAHLREQWPAYEF